MTPGHCSGAQYCYVHFLLLCKALCAVLLGCLVGSPAASLAEGAAQSSYTNVVDPRGPWSIHVVKIPRNNAYELRSVHATGRAIGLSALTDQVRLIFSQNLTAIAAVNGDFFQREGAHAGDPKGLQIVDGELISAPTGNASFWIDALGQPQVGNVTETFRVIWPDGTSASFDLNGSRDPDGIELFTPPMGRSTRAERGRDFILEQDGTSPWLPLRPGRSYRAKVRAVRDGANTEIPRDGMVLSVGSSLAREIPKVAAGDILTLSTLTKPDLRGAKTAISGGPVLLRGGSVSRFRGRGGESGSINMRHPRSAIGWNSESFFLVGVDGRQRRSVGMTGPELADFFSKLGCTDAMNLDGGGSSTLWYDGKVRNRPCEGSEREIANSIVVVAKGAGDTPKGTKTAAAE